MFHLQLLNLERNQLIATNNRLIQEYEENKTKLNIINDAIYQINQFEKQQKDINAHLKKINNLVQ